MYICEFGSYTSFRKKRQQRNHNKAREPNFNVGDAITKYKKIKSFSWLPSLITQENPLRAAKHAGKCVSNVLGSSYMVDTPSVHSIEIRPKPVYMFVCDKHGMVGNIFFGLHSMNAQTTTVGSK